MDTFGRVVEERAKKKEGEEAKGAGKWSSGGRSEGTGEKGHRKGFRVHVPSAGGANGDRKEEVETNERDKEEEGRSCRRGGD